MRIGPIRLLVGTSHLRRVLNTHQSPGMDENPKIIPTILVRQAM